MEESNVEDLSLEAVQHCMHCRKVLDEPIRLQCLHSCCKKCLDQIALEDPENDPTGWNCEICGRFTKQEDGKENTLLAAFIVMEETRKKIQAKTCEFCEKNRMDLKFCLDCRMAICDECIRIHERTPVTKQHNIENMIINELFYCEQHNTQQLELYCDTCEELICSVCLDDHHEHSVEGSNKALDEIVKQMDALIPEIRPKLALVQVQQELVNNTMENLKETYKNLGTELKRQLEILVNKIEETKIIVEEKVKQEESRNIQKLRELKSKIQQKEERIKHVTTLATVIKYRIKFRNQSQLMELESLLLEQAKELCKDETWEEHFQITFPIIDKKTYDNIIDTIINIVKHVKFNEVTKLIDHLGQISDQETLESSEYMLHEDYLWQNFEMINTTGHLNKWCYTVNTIDEFLYVGVRGRNIIQKYNRSGELIKKFNNVHHTMVVKKMNNGDIIAAGDKGLYVTNKDFSQWTQLLEGSYSDIAVHGNKITGIDFQKSKLVTFKYDNNRQEWKMEVLFYLELKPSDTKLGQSHGTLMVDKNMNVLICNSNKLLLYSNKGEFVRSVELIEYHNRILGMDSKGNAILGSFHSGKLYSIKIDADIVQQHFICEKNKYIRDMAVDCDGHLWILHGNLEYCQLRKYKNNGKLSVQTSPISNILEYSHLDFKRYLGEKFEMEKKTEVSSKWCNRMNIISEFLYIGVSGNNIIQKYDKRGEIVKQYNDVHHTIVIKRMINGDFIAGGNDGLFVTDRDFSKWTQLIKGSYADIAVHGNKFTAIEYEQMRVVTFKYDNNKKEWQFESLFEITEQHKSQWNSLKDETRKHKIQQKSHQNETGANSTLGNHQNKTGANSTLGNHQNETGANSTLGNRQNETGANSTLGNRQNETGKEIYGSCQHRTKRRYTGNHNATLILDKDNDIILCNKNILLIYSQKGEPLKHIKLLESPYRLSGLDKKGNVILCDFWSGKVYSIENIKQLDVNNMAQYLVWEKHLYTRDIKLDKEGNLWILHGNENNEAKYYLTKYIQKRYISIYVEDKVVSGNE